MCEPATLSAVAMYASIAGAGLAAYSAYDSSRTNKAIAEGNAMVSKIKAQDALRRGEEAKIKAQQQGAIIQGQQRAALASRGLDLQEGTPASILGQSDYFTQGDAELARTNARREAWSHEAQQANFDRQADGINPGLSMAGSLLGSSGQVSDRWYAYKRQTAGG